MTDTTLALALDVRRHIESLPDRSARAEAIYTIVYEGIYDGVKFARTPDSTVPGAGLDGRGTPERDWAGELVNLAAKPPRG